MGKWSDLARELEAARVTSPLPESLPIAPIAPIGQPSACDEAESTPVAAAIGTNGTNGTTGTKTSRADKLPLQWWAARVATMDSQPPPGVPPRWWSTLREAARRFVAEWGDTAVALGWTDADLFAVDARAPYTRIDQYGLVPLLAGPLERRVIAMTETGATIQTGQHRASFRRWPQEPPGIVLVWTLNDWRNRNESL